MAKAVKKWTGTLFLAVVAVAFAALAFDYVGVDAASEPPEAVSFSGHVVGCERMSGGLLLSLDGGDDVVLVVSGVGDTPLGYQMLSDCGDVLASGEGLYVPLSEWPDAANPEGRYFSSRSRRRTS